MPFKKVGNKYVSPSGKKWTKKQVVAYYASDGFKKKKKKWSPQYLKTGLMRIEKGLTPKPQSPQKKQKNASIS